MKIVVDTNIVFSALVSSCNAMAEIIIGAGKNYQFYTNECMLYELNKHRSKLQKASKLCEKELDVAQTEFFKYINLITLEIIPKKYWVQAEVIDIDPDDTPFIALSIFLNAYLWTGDKILYNGLLRKGFNKVLTTPQLKEML